MLVSIFVLYIHFEWLLTKYNFFFVGSNVFTENETIAKYEIMDGAPVKGESIPIRVFLAGYDLTPTMRDINKKFSVRYFLNLVLMDTEDRRYFKQQEITLWRKSEKTRKSLSNSAIGGSSGQGSTNNLTQAQQNAQMPTHLVQGSSSLIHHNLTTSSTTTTNEHEPSVGNVVSSPVAPTFTDQSNMGLFTEEESPQHEALGSKVRSNPLAFDTDDDKTPSKEEEAPITSNTNTNNNNKDQPQQQQSIDESSSLFDEPANTVTSTEQQTSNAISNNDVQTSDTTTED